MQLHQWGRMVSFGPLTFTVVWHRWKRPETLRAATIAKLCMFQACKNTAQLICLHNEKHARFLNPTNLQIIFFGNAAGCHYSPQISLNTNTEIALFSQVSL